MRDVMSAPAITLSARRDRRRRGAGDGAQRNPPRRRAATPAARSPASSPSAICSACSGCRCASSPRRSAAPPTSRRSIQCAADIRALSHALVAQGVAAGHLTRMISSLNDQLAVRILELVGAAVRSRRALRCAGSEWARKAASEQTIATDQDNGLIFVDRRRRGRAGRGPRAPAPVRARRQRGAWTAAAIRLCKGGVMAMNPRWCASLDEWKAAFANWIDRGDPDSLLAASIFFDFRRVVGRRRGSPTRCAPTSRRARRPIRGS